MNPQEHGNPNDYPERAGLTTAALAQIDESDPKLQSDLDELDNILDEKREDQSRDGGRLQRATEVTEPPIVQSDPYLGNSNGDARPAAGNPAETQSFRELLEADSPAETPHSETPNLSDADHPAPLFSASESNELVSRWSSVQAAFVDEPRQAVEQADELVATTMQRLAEIFAEERARLEGQWDGGDSVSTEELRIALRRYRSFFRRLLAV